MPRDYFKYPELDKHSQPSPAWQAFIESYLLAMAARNMALTTIRSYRIALDVFAKWMTANTHDDPITVSKKDVETWIIATRAAHSGATVRHYFATAQRFYVWLKDEDEIAANPFASFPLPPEPESTRMPIGLEHIETLFKHLSGKDFYSIRDLAIMRLFLDTGARMSELAGLRVDDLDMKAHRIIVAGKGKKMEGKRQRILPFGKRTAVAVDRYLRARTRHKHTALDVLWLSDRGGMKQSYFPHMVIRRGREAGIPHIHPHLFRHTFAHMWLEAGGQEGDLKRLGGWDSNAIDRYTKALAHERAIKAHEDFSPGDRV